MDKKQLKAQRKKERNDRIREIDRMKWTHEWVSTQVYSLNGTRMQNTNIHCKKCGMGLYNFRVRPMSCSDVAVHDVISSEPDLGHIGI